MAHRFNYTQRERIRLEHVSVSVAHDTSPLKVYLVAQLGAYKTFADNDRVVLEAIRRTKAQRKDLGLVSTLGEKKEVVFDEFSDGEDVYYRLKVVDAASPRIKGMAEEIHRADKPDPQTPMQGILPVQFADPTDGLKEQFWKIDFQSTGPVLLLAPGKVRNKECVKTPEFRALVWPQAMRNILTFAYLICADDTPEWADNWGKFAEAKGAGKPPEWDEKNLLEIHEWIDQAVACFSEHARLNTVEIKGITKEVLS